MRVLVDSDALYAMFLPKDPSHGSAAAMMRTLVDRHDDLFVSNLVLQEVVTLLSYRCNQELAVKFVGNFEKGGFDKVFLDERLTYLTWRLFEKQTKKRTSFIGCSNVVLYKEQGFDAIFSFDKFYVKNKVKTVWQL